MTTSEESMSLEISDSVGASELETGEESTPVAEEYSENEILPEAETNVSDETEPQGEDANEELERLRGEVESLRAQLEKKQSENERALLELAEFSELFPNIAVSSIPEEVWQKVKVGVPLSASYALYEKKTQRQAELAAAVNQKNAEKSSGAISRDGGEVYYSPSEVRSMSSGEVRKNYNKIIESMKKWS